MKKQLFMVGMTVLLIAVGLSGCTQENLENENTLNNLEWSNSVHGVGINPPDDWTVDENDIGIVAFYSRNENDVAVIHIEGPIPMNGWTLQDNAEQQIAQDQDIVTNYTLISSTQTKINNLNAWEIIYTSDVDIYNMITRSIVIQNNDKTYRITYLGLSESYNDYLSVIDQSINSFTIV